MVVHPRYPDLVLTDAAEVSADRIPDRLRPYQAALQAVVAWSWSYLCRPHSRLGRRGAVCPYTRSSLRSGGFYLGVCGGRPHGPRQVAQLLSRYREWFAELEPTAGRDALLKAVLVLFPEVPREDWPTIIDGSQALLKPEFVRHGLMIGEFHDGPPPRSGLHNPDFRPLRSPVPMLVIRQMIATDLPFLRGDREFLHAYLARFGDQLPPAELLRFEAAVRRFEFEHAGGAIR